MRIGGDVAATHTWIETRDEFRNGIYAIAVKGAQEYTIHGRKWVALELSQMRDMEQFCDQQATKEAAGTRYDSVVATRRPL